MTRAEWGKVAGSILALWPAQPWPNATVEIGFELMGDEPFEAARKAVIKLARSGREFAPPPSVLYEYTRAELPNIHLALPEAEPQDYNEEEIAERKQWLEDVKARVAASKAMS